MQALRKRQKVRAACQRCRQRKLGCDVRRPCQLCIRAGVQCISRDPAGQDPSGDDPSPNEPELSPSTAQSRHETSDKSTVHSLVLPESSIIDLSSQVFSTMSLQQEQEPGVDTSALPGGHKLIARGSSSGLPWRQVVGVQMPDEPTLHQLVDTFFASVDWFMMVFHEPSFRERYQLLLDSDRVTYYDENFLWLFVLTVALGAYYQSSSSGDHNGELAQLANSLVARIEIRFLGLLGCATLEAVQICILMGSFFLFGGRPNVGLGIAAAGVKIAQVINLHRENRWRDASDAVRETKRRTWWALEVFDKYAAIAIGRPCIVDDSDCSVSMIRDIGETPNPLLVCHEQKFRLYRIMGQFIARRHRENNGSNVNAIHQELTQWKSQLPSQLQIDLYSDDEDPSIMQMQALALQLTYDNLQIVLHRTAVFKGGSKLQESNSETAFSLRQLTEAGVRTADLQRFPKTLQASRRTHANMHIGITLFTAGVVLCVVCLAQPLSSESHLAKNGIRRIIRLCQDASPGQNLVSTQSIAMLERLVDAVLQVESRLITGRRTEPLGGNGPSFSPARDSAHGVGMTPEMGETALEPIQHILAHHVRRPARAVPESVGDGQPASFNESAGSGLTHGFDWDGDLSLLVDSGLTDASQMWLWAESMDFDTFAQ